MGIKLELGDGNGKQWKLTAWEREGMKMQNSISGHL